MTRTVDDRRAGGRCRTCNDIAYRSEKDAKANKGRIFPFAVGRLTFKGCPRACGLWIVKRLTREDEQT